MASVPYTATDLTTSAPRQWLERPAAAAPDALARALGLPDILARHLVRRGVTDAAEAEKFLQPRLADMHAPSLMAGMPEAVERVCRAIRNKEVIGLCGDYDVDGVTSTTLMAEVLRAFGNNPVLYIPHRIRDGYGLNHAAVEAMAQRGVRLLITLDCGVTAHAEVEGAVARGMDVIVIDHHTVPVTLPRAVAVLNPHRTDCGFPFKDLCAVGVTFYLCVALRAALREAGLAGPDGGPDLKTWLDLVALGTVADMVPLRGQNRILVAQGLKILRQAKRPGIRALLEVASIAPADVDAGTLGFQLGPRINAAGRLQEAMLGVRLLLSWDPAEVKELAAVLDQENQSRKDVERRTVEDALGMGRQEPHLSARALVLFDEAWHPGVVGIAAQRMVEAFHKPAILIGAGGKGSGRSIEAFHLHHALSLTSDLLVGFGGHAHAAGLRLDPAKLDAFRSALYAHALDTLTPEHLVPRSHHDGVLPLAAVTQDTMDALLRAAPFGRGNSEPSFLVPSARVASTRVVGKTQEHLQVEFAGGLRGIAFKMAPDADAMRSGPADFLVTPRVEVWKGNSRLGLNVRDWRPAQGLE